ncbi:MAG TPA: hypothetical protein VH280_07595 [Verrucomicrobiae bacterium]|jgi:hypothetical protein|nr:hypothetical protein [Verrucomicrobiae bacterium]
MPSPEIEEFAKLMVEHVRDQSIRDGDRKLQAQANGVGAKRWRELKSRGDLGAISKVLIPDVVDSVLQHLLYAIDNELLRLSFTASTGKTIDLSNDGLGEMCGWYLGGGDGWRERFSKERYVDDFADVKARFAEQLRQRDERNKGKESGPES